jgi:hypothetical protein
MEWDEDPKKIGFQDLQRLLPANIYELLDKRDSTATLIKRLPEVWSPSDVAPPPNSGDQKTVPARLWELVGLRLLYLGRPFEALTVFNLLYQHMLRAQIQNNRRIHKGMPLLWISECFQKLGFVLHAKRYLMLTLVEDALTSPGKVNPDDTGSYFRLVWRYGLLGDEFDRYVDEVKQLAIRHPRESHFPEWLLQEIDQKWMIEFPSLRESAYYFISEGYATHLINQLGEPSGKVLERLANYLLSTIPGFRATTRRKSRTTDYDVVCTVEGNEIDFRAEIGRYFVCECKDLGNSVDFSIIAKFCRVLDSTKCKFGILFSTKGISGSGKGTYAEREQMKIYQDRGLVIVTVDRDDFNAIAEGSNFVTILRERYERVRLDLI